MKNNYKNNYFDGIPVRCEAVNYQTDDENQVILVVKHDTVFDKIAQRLFKKPRISYIRLDRLGSFVWLQLDGKKTVYEVSGAVKQQFGTHAGPLYERLAVYMRQLEQCGLIVIYH